MTIKILGCICIVFGTTLWGFRHSESLERRVKQLKQLQLLILNLQSEVMYLYSPLPEAFENIAIKSNDEIGLIFKKVSEILQLNQVDSVYEAFRIVVNEEKYRLDLYEEDYAVILTLSKNLGDLDRDSQENIFNLSDITLKQHIKSAEEKAEKNKKLYRYLGFSLGAIIVIIIV